MNSDPPSRRRPWLTLAWWHHHDQRLKHALNQTFGAPTNLTTEQVCTLIERTGLVLGIPLLLTPPLTALLYPWLPQKHALLFTFYAATCLGGALLARLKRADLANETTSETMQSSVSPLPAAGQEMREEPLSEFDEETQPGS